MSNICRELSEGTKGLVSGIADRAIWFHLLVQAAEKQNVDIEKLTDDAIFTYGKNLYAGRTAKTAGDFVSIMTESELGREAFGQEIVLNGENHAIAHFHACPLVQAWKEYGLSDERVAYLCDLASKGDFGRASNFPNLEISFPKKIAHKDDVCELVVVTK